MIARSRSIAPLFVAVVVFLPLAGICLGIVLSLIVVASHLSL